MKNVSIIQPHAEPFFIPGGKIGCLLVHGFTGTPNEMRWLGKALGQEGHTVLGVRLFGHGTQSEDMIRSRWWDWLASVEDGYHLLSGFTEKIIILGLSMGGILSLIFSARYPVAGVVAMSTPHHLPNDPRLPYAKLISMFVPFISKGPPDWHDQDAYKKQICYPKDPTRCFTELMLLIGEMQRSLPGISAPALLINSRGDQTVKVEDQHQELIYAALGSQDKSTMWVENSGHVITSDAERLQVFQACMDFIDRVS
jgi:carboxylesterase